MTDEGVRLSKRVAALRGCSRRDAELYITQGWVRVDGVLADAPQSRVAEHQRVEVDSRAQLQPSEPATLLIHKPAGWTLEQALAQVSTQTRWGDDPSGIRRVRSHAHGLIPLMPLPAAASGLCVFSQDGRIVRKLQEDAWQIEQELIAGVSGTPAPGALARLCHGLVHEGRPLPAARVSWQSEHRLRFALKGIAPDWVPWMCAQVGLQLTELRRLRIGRVALAALPVGQWRYLSPGDRF